MQDIKYCVYDIENYPNYFLIGFKFLDTKEVFQFEIREDRELTIYDKIKLEDILKEYHLVGFNNKSYDDNIIHSILNREVYNKPFTAKDIDNIANSIIKDKYYGKHYEYLRTVDLFKLVKDRQVRTKILCLSYGF